MDPDETLKDILLTIHGWLEREDPNDVLDSFVDLAENVQGLSDWLTKGGYLPTQWKKANR